MEIAMQAVSGEPISGFKFFAQENAPWNPPWGFSVIKVGVNYLCGYEHTYKFLLGTVQLRVSVLYRYSNNLGNGVSACT
jgi:hypothetical protein